MRTVLSRLKAAYPVAECALHHESPFQLLAATILSAQCTDARVNQTTPALFARFPDAPALATADVKEVETLVQSCGFFRSKAKNLVGMATALVERHGGEVPRRLEDLVTLPGVGRKTANVVLGVCFGIAEGVVVDTHVGRISRRLAFTTESDAVKAERDLCELLPRSRWVSFSHRLILHGRSVCDARKPRCGECVLRSVCPRVGVGGTGEE
ncbi:endonuclease III [Alienimonas californiensis]|uniref:Endonuclease III n=1 Tax=Alienimonas californiensis TaxID=2527989 RepID=A0A517PCH4_9PLAN|nr:endonuclease III [Alienimonas californiensis]QDT17062.1 Ultraviolet N-glycosylase/AP lyase [Alienimonas californiensis]